MSAWYVLSALGFYPVNPAEATYVIGVPSFPRAVLQLPGGRSLVLAATELSPQSRYVGGVRLNGKPLDRVWLRHGELASGGSLEYQMAPAPDPRWGREVSAAPPSLSGPPRN